MGCARKNRGSFDSISFKELSLSSDKEYVVLEIRSEKLLGSFSGEYHLRDIEPQYNCQLFCIKERKWHQQVIATNRPISCGGYELNSVKWEKDTLWGKGKIVGGDTYRKSITEAEGKVFDSFSCDGGRNPE